MVHLYLNCTIKQLFLKLQVYVYFNKYWRLTSLAGNTNSISRDDEGNSLIGVSYLERKWQSFFTSVYSIMFRVLNNHAKNFSLFSILLTIINFEYF